MTQKTKLEIIGPYTPEHEGPFCTRDGQHVRVVTLTDGSEKFPIIGFFPDLNTPSVWGAKGNFYGSKDEHGKDLMNAREVPVAREFWVNEYSGKDGLFHNIFDNEATAHRHKADTFLRTIHVREVLPGDDQ